MTVSKILMLWHGSQSYWTDLEEHSSDHRQQNESWRSAADGTTAAQAGISSCMWCCRIQCCKYGGMHHCNAKEAPHKDVKGRVYPADVCENLIRCSALVPKVLEPEPNILQWGSHFPHGD
jgi:hypothetical protein